MKDITKKSSIFFFFIFTSLIIFLTILSIQKNLLQHQQLILTTFPNAHGTTGNTLNFNPSQLTENQKEIYREPISEMLPANIELNYNGSIFFGKLIDYKYREGLSYTALKEEQRTLDIGDELISVDVPIIKNLSKYIPKNTITITNGSELKFRIIGYPERMEPSSLSINSYQINEDYDKILQNPKVLQIADNQNELSFNVNLSPGKYLFVSTATWVSDTPEQIAGYVMYAYHIHVNNNLT
jgi:hypothetical protein